MHTVKIGFVALIIFKIIKIIEISNQEELLQIGDIFLGQNVLWIDKDEIEAVNGAVELDFDLYFWLSENI